MCWVFVKTRCSRRGGGLPELAGALRQDLESKGGNSNGVSSNYETTFAMKLEARCSSAPGREGGCGRAATDGCDS